MASIKRGLRRVCLTRLACPIACLTKLLKLLTECSRREALASSTRQRSVRFLTLPVEKDEADEHEHRVQIKLLGSVVGPGEALIVLDDPIHEQNHRAEQEELRDGEEDAEEEATRRRARLFLEGVLMVDRSMLRLMLLMMLPADGEHELVGKEW